MSNFEPPENSDQWAREKRLKIRCKYHPAVWHDPNIQCPSCRKEEDDKRIKLSKQGKEALNSIFSSDNKPTIKKKKCHWPWPK